MAALCSLSAAAQNEVLEGYVDFHRPELIETYVTDATGTHPGKHRIGVPGQFIKLSGSPKIPILLVEFPDRPFSASGATAEEVRANFDIFFNSEDDKLVYDKTRSSGSVFSYFNDMSRGVFLPDFEMIGPIMLDNGYAYYGQDTGVKDCRISELYKEAVMKAIKNFDVDWLRFDNNGDGKVDFVHIVHAGWGQNVASYDRDAIWAKEMPSGYTVNVDDGNSVSFACFAISAEARYKSSAQYRKDVEGEFAPSGYNPANLMMDGIGVCVHEFSHALGLPDFYDKNSKEYGMDIWSVMDYGNYCNNGFSPVCYTAYERNFMGWEELPVLTEPQVLTLTCFAEGGTGYKIVNPANENEYYVIENRQGKGWDTMLSKYGHGMLVTHIDYSQNLWMSNNVNTPSSSSHQRMTVIPSSNTLFGSTSIVDAASQQAWKDAIGGCPYPGTSFNYNLTDESLPAAKVYAKNNGEYLMSQPLRNITENADGTITVCFRTNGKLDTPVVNEATNVDEHGFTASWETVENATKYVIEMEVENEEAVRDTLTDTQLSYTELTSSTAVKYRVMAMADTPEDYVSSEWSDYIYLNTDEDFIADVPNSEKMVTVYAMNGMPVSHCKANELHRLDVCPGIYVVKYANGATRKVVLN